MSTYAQTRADLIQAFTPRAQRFAELIRNRHLQSWSQDRRNIKRYHPTKMDFSYISDSFPIDRAEFTTHEIPGGGDAVKFWFNPWCFIAYYDIRPRAGATAQVSRAPAVLLRKSVIGGARVGLENHTDDEQPMTRSFERVQASGQTTDIGAKASAQFRQLIKAGSEAVGFESETEITLAVEASTNISNWHSETLADKTEWAGMVPAKTRRSFDRLVSVGRYQQQVTIDGELDYSVYVLSRGDFDVNFDGRDDLSAVLSGVGDTGRGGHYADWSRAYSRWPLTGGSEWGGRDWWLNEIAGPVTARVIEFDQSDQATEENIVWTDEAL